MNKAVAPVVMVNVTRAQNTWLAHQALLRAELTDPALRDNPAWAVLRQAAYKNFELAFEGKL